eukprot:3926575-Pleurochrysis_carterae.AAC.1
MGACLLTPYVSTLFLRACPWPSLFQAQHQMQFEPDLLEACRLMRVEALALLPGARRHLHASQRADA